MHKVLVVPNLTRAVRYAIAHLGLYSGWSVHEHHGETPADNTVGPGLGSQGPVEMMLLASPHPPSFGRAMLRENSAHAE